jgi:hypothetical protein
MFFAPGTKIAVHEVVALIGAGGVGEVYRANDTKLGRDVIVIPTVSHLHGWRQNNRIENSHQPLRRRERRLQRFKSLRHAARPCSVFSTVCNLETRGRGLSSSRRSASSSLHIRATNRILRLYRRGLMRQTHSEAAPQTAKNDLAVVERVVKDVRLRLRCDSGDPPDRVRCAALPPLGSARCWT